MLGSSITPFRGGDGGGAAGGGLGGGLACTRVSGMLPMPDPSNIQVVGACSEKTPKAWELNKEGCAIIADLFGTNGSSFAGLKPLKSVSSLL